MCVCARVHAHAGYLPQLLPTLVLTLELSLNLELTDWLQWLDIKLSELSCLGSPVLEPQDHADSKAGLSRQLSLCHRQDSLLLPQTEP